MNNDAKNGSGEQASAVVCQSSHGYDLHGTPLRLGPQMVAFEVYHPSAVLHLSEVLSPFRIVINGHAAYSGRAVVTSVVRTDGALVCEANLGECWLSPGPSPATEGLRTQQQFRTFLREWQHWYKI